MMTWGLAVGLPLIVLAWILAWVWRGHRRPRLEPGERLDRLHAAMYGRPRRPER
jgi:hypothetical protein